jgi:hypothetical protein
MPDLEDFHECDLFLLSSFHAYQADRSLAEFARQGARNMDGWGIGGLIAACRRAYRSLLDQDPTGKFNLILSNGYLTFAFVHWRDFYLLHRSSHPV